MNQTHTQSPEAGFGLPAGMRAARRCRRACEAEPFHPESGGWLPWRPLTPAGAKAYREGKEGDQSTGPRARSVLRRG